MQVPNNNYNQTIYRVSLLSLLCDYDFLSLDFTCRLEYSQYTMLFVNTAWCQML